MVITKIPLTAAFMLFAFCVRPAMACECGETPSPVESFQKTPVVFVGLVNSVDEGFADMQRGGDTVKVRVGLTAHFSVEEALKGVSGTNVDVVTGGGGGDCGYDFKVGERYLVYAYRSEAETLNSSVSRTVIGGVERSAPKGNAVLGASICSRTRRLAYAQEDIDLIHAVLNNKPTNRIFGVVNDYITKLGEVATPDITVKPMAGLTVKAEGSEGQYQTTTDAEGHFRLEALKPGKYRLSFVLPSGYGMLFSFEKSEFDVEVKPGFWSQEFRLQVKVDGHLSGRVYDTQGKPVGRNVRVSIIRAESAGSEPPATQSRNKYTNPQGEYDFDGVPPGRYILGVSIADAPDKWTPYPSLYYPSGSSPSQATVLSVGMGEKLAGLDIHLPTPLEERMIEGVAVFEDGTPVVKAKVMLYDRQQTSRWIDGSEAETDSQGHFRVKGYRGRHYRVRAYVAENYSYGMGKHFEEVEVGSEDDGAPIKLVMKKAVTTPKQN